MSRLTAAALAAGLLASVPLFAADTPKAADKAEKPGVNPESLPTNQAINHYIAAGWETAGIKKAAAPCTDAEFLRRACLDLLGRIATVEEVLDFEQDKGRDKRQRLIRRLLHGVPQTKDGKPVLDKEGKPVAGVYTPKVDGKPVKGSDGKEVSFDYPNEFAEHWANMWTVWLMSRTGHPVYRGQMQAWLWQQFYDNRPHHEVVRDLITATGSTNRNGAANFVVAHLGDPVPQELQREYGIHDAVPITSRVTRLFLGLQTQCTQCHDHPFNKEWVQSDFWGVNAFFRQTKRSATPSPRNMQNNNNMMLQDKIELTDDPGLNSAAKVQFEQRNGSPASVRPVFLKDYKQAMDGVKSDKKLSAVEGAKTRRQALADYLIAHDNFAPAFVNRVWGHLFGRGLNKEPGVDDFGSNNEVVHPELMARLATDFKRYNYDTKMLFEAICTSDVYGLSHVASKGYEDAKFDAFFARMPLKAMSPEVLFESLTLATKSAPSDKNERANLRDQWMNKLVRNFGDDEGNEGTFNGTVVQALLMMNGRELNKEVTRAGGVVEEAMKKHIKGGAINVNGVLDELFLTALNRHATAAELAALKDVQDGTIAAGRDDKKDEPKKPTDPKKPATKPEPKKPDAKPTGTVIMGTGPADKKFYQDVFWALLNTTEFMLNH
ncbi:MAG: DUF1549 and DUF1553 domain-containing protein [Fimbriiglobus sp.]|jgi:hypothetical protein|nr:DUF1549 and DUF1553 domain-containing protein [Fimbriiglobus sp.]